MILSHWPITARGGRHTPQEIRPAGLRAGEEKKRKKRNATGGMRMDFDKSRQPPHGESSKGLYWEDVNKIPGPNLQGGTRP